mmetsp:Transcript_99603/g.267461  ORF Transcript_99603/g.267461 Transcript_99603/m.267461 type:complete len:426 (-) Transcript_99603:492-1769(-)
MCMQIFKQGTIAIAVVAVAIELDAVAGVEAALHQAARLPAATQKYFDNLTRLNGQAQVVETNLDTRLAPRHRHIVTERTGSLPSDALDDPHYANHPLTKILRIVLHAGAIVVRSFRRGRTKPGHEAQALFQATALLHEVVVINEKFINLKLGVRIEDRIVAIRGGPCSFAAHHLRRRAVGQAEAAKAPTPGQLERAEVFAGARGRRNARHAARWGTLHGRGGDFLAEIELGSHLAEKLLQLLILGIPDDVCLAVLGLFGDLCQLSLLLNRQGRGHRALSRRHGRGNRTRSCALRRSVNAERALDCQVASLGSQRDRPAISGPTDAHADAASRAERDGHRRGDEPTGLSAAAHGIGAHGAEQLEVAGVVAAAYLLLLRPSTWIAQRIQASRALHRAVARACAAGCTARVPLVRKPIRHCREELGEH